MKAENAEKKWCPFMPYMRTKRSVEAAIYQDKQVTAGHLCIAQACMAWQSEGGTEHGYCRLICK